MEFLLFQPPYLGYGVVIGLNAVIHVIISHGIAIGTVSMIALAEYVGVSKHMVEGEVFAKKLLTPTVVAVTGVGTITGVGIWFTTSAMVPAGIGSMLRIFFWPWFIEWLVFVLETVFLLFIYLKWDAWAGRKMYRVYFGFAYSGLGILSAVLITGILGFMLTPDGWPWNKNFWSAFFNPSFLPQLFLRLGVSFSLGVLFAAGCLLFTKAGRQFRAAMMRIYGSVFLISCVIASLSAWWYFTAVPSTFKTFAILATLTSYLSQKPEIFWTVNAASSLVLLAFAALLLARAALLSRLLVIPVLLVSFFLVGEYENIREFIRGPYLMPGYMYSNQILLKESYFFRKEGLLPNAYWFNELVPNPSETDKGAFLFAQNCSSCHTIEGVNDIKDKVQGRTEDGIAVILNHTNDMVPFMPPFSGNGEERHILAKFLFQLNLKGGNGPSSPYPRGGPGSDE
ncbi:MAG: c-type cytochrome [Nitrospiraceae bacterium]|nr:c-type cytochrome [Nitrospiraceae bacterium]